MLKGAPRAWALSINSNLASAYRDIQLELRALVNKPTRKIPAIAEKDQKIGGAFGCDPTADRAPALMREPSPSTYCEPRSEWWCSPSAAALFG